jgi:hypothetical protein
MVSAALSGTALEDARLQLVPGSQDFGTVAAPGTSAPVSFTLTNVGDLPTDTLTYSFTGSDASEFSMIGGGTCGARLAPGESCSTIVVFEPTEPGAKSAFLVATDERTTAMSALAGTGNNDGGRWLGVSPSLHDFGTAAVGTTSSGAVFNVQNPTGTTIGPISIDIAGAHLGDFMVVTNGCSGVGVAPGGACSVTVVFSPTATGSRTATLRASAPLTSPVSAGLYGTGS